MVNYPGTFSNSISLEGMRTDREGRPLASFSHKDKIQELGMGAPETSGYNLWGGQGGRGTLQHCLPCPTVILEKCSMGNIVTGVTALSPLPCRHWDEGWALETEGIQRKLPCHCFLPSLFMINSFHEHSIYSAPQSSR